MKQFKVIRAHIGDRDYAVGDIREATEVEVKHLIGTCLEPVEAESSEDQSEGGSEKDSGGAPENKAMKGAPKNKAEQAEQAG